MSQTFHAGDFLIFQLESGFALLRILAIVTGSGGATWHLAAYRDLFPDIEAAEMALENSS